HPSVVRFQRSGIVAIHGLRVEFTSRMVYPVRSVSTGRRCCTGLLRKDLHSNGVIPLRQKTRLRVFFPKPGVFSRCKSNSARASPLSALFAGLKRFVRAATAPFVLQKVLRETTDLAGLFLLGRGPILNA